MSAQDLTDMLCDARARIPELRKQGQYVTANTLRDDLLSQVEQWIDPETAALRNRAHPPRRSGAAMAANIDPICGF